MAPPFPRLTTPHFFVPVKHFVFSLSGTKKRQLPRTLGEMGQISEKTERMKLDMQHKIWYK